MGETALITPPKSDKPKQHRLTDNDKVMAIRYANDGLTQAVIAQRLGVTQPAISQWLSKCQDTTAEAGLFFRGRALAMAEKVERKGRPSDLIKALQGVNVLTEERSAGLVIQIGGGQGDVKVAVMTTFAPVNESASQVNISSIIRTEEMANPSND
jgi:transposase-like protein